MDFAHDFVGSPIFELSLPKRHLRPSELRRRTNNAYYGEYPAWGYQNPEFEQLLDALQLPMDSETDSDTSSVYTTKSKPIDVKKKSKAFRSFEKKDLTPTLADQIFVTMLHTQLNTIRATSLEETYKKFIVLLMNNWEDVLEPSNRVEKETFKKFKQNHDKLTREEWNHLCSYITKAKVDVRNNFDLQELLDILNTERKQRSSSPSSSPNTNSESPKSLLSSSVEAADVDKQISDMDLFKLYICIQYPNYKELWDSDSVILRASLSKEIDKFLNEHSKPNPEILEALFNAVSGL